MHNRLTASIAAALLFASAGAGASTLSFTPAAATALPGAGNGTTPTPIQVTYDNTGSTADSLEFEITFDDVDLNVTTSPAAGYSCAVGAGIITVIGADIGGNTLASGNLCALTFTTDAGAADGEVKNLAFQNVVVSDGGGAAVAPTTTPGAITIAAAPPATPPTLTFSPAGGTVASGSNITITPSGGQAGGSATYSCTPPAGVTVTNNAGTINTGGAAVTMSVTCPAGNADGPMSCTHTGGAGSTASPVNYTIDCPPAPAPVLTANPPNGTPLACNGAAGSTQTATVQFTNTGNANVTGLTCSVTGAGFAIGTAPAGTVAPSASTSVVVNCTVPADGAPPATGTLNCTSTAPGGALAYPLSSQAQNQGGLTQAAIVPASSLWSKVGLIGLLAVLGMMVVGFRRK